MASDHITTTELDDLIRRAADATSALIRGDIRAYLFPQVDALPAGKKRITIRLDDDVIT